MPAREQRRLAAIVAADVVGYSWLMGRDEAGTLARLKEHRAQRLDPALASNGGRLVKLTGDGVLAEFGSAVDALKAAIEFQQAVDQSNAAMPEEQRIVFRVGVHVGDLIVDGDDLYGDGVNVAARLEGEAPSGGIVVSGTARDFVGERVKARFADLGELTLKNIERPVRAWRIEWDAADWKPAATPAPELDRPDEPVAPALTLPDKPSIAVLPFQNMSGDPEQEYFADGMVEDIITALSRFKALFVIARNSSFTYKGKAVDIKQVGRELGVRYVLEGSMRKAAHRVRVTAQLIDCGTNSHIWAERYDRVFEDIFELQEELTQSIVAAIAPEIDIAEEQRAARHRPADLTAYDLALRAWAHGVEGYERSERTLLEQAISEAERALAIDPMSTLALRSLAIARVRGAFLGFAEDPQDAFKRAEAEASRAVELDVASGAGYTARAFCISLQREHNRYPDALADAYHGHQLNPNDTFALYVVGQIELFMGNAEAALKHAHQVLRLSPLDRRIHFTYVLMAAACWLAERYAEGLDWALRAQKDSRAFLGRLNAILCFVGLGEIERARAEFTVAQSMAPRLIQNILDGGRVTYARPMDQARQRKFLRVAARLEEPDTRVI